MKLDENDLAASLVELARDVARSIDAHDGRSYPDRLVTTYRSTMKELGRLFRAGQAASIPEELTADNLAPASRLQELRQRRAIGS